MKRAVIIVRSSTKKQEIDSQTDEIVKFVISEGYSADEIEIIGASGASAIKLDDRYLENINKVYHTIYNNPIECVYAWALDRIGRQEELMMRFKNFLIDRKINLKIKEPTLFLLNEDSTVNTGMELAISLFVTMAKQEMEQKNARFKRAKKRNHDMGKFNGGAETRFGYEVVNGFFGINKEEADIVRLIFEEYATGAYSLQKLCEELESRGIRHRGKIFKIDFLHGVLTDKTYIGEGNKAAIVEKKVFDKVTEIRALNTSPLLTKESKNIHLATKILVCEECGNNYSANFDRYVCYKHRFNRRFQEVCHNDLTIRINLMDVIIWNIAFEMHKKYLSVVDKTKIKEIDAELAILGQKVMEIYNKIEALKERRERVIELYTDGITTKEQFTKAENKIKTDLDNYNKTLDTYNEKIEYYKELAEKVKNPDADITVNSQEEKKKIVTKHIKKAVVRRYEYLGKVMTQIIFNDTIQILYNPWSKRKTDNNIYYWVNEKWVAKYRV